LITFQGFDEWAVNWLFMVHKVHLITKAAILALPGFVEMGSE
jgi:hypothetical protein